MFDVRVSPNHLRIAFTVRAMLLDAAENGPVFFKDMSYYVVPRIFEDEAFARRMRNVFLIRDPRRSIASYYKLDPTFSLEETGIEAQWQHYSFLREYLAYHGVFYDKLKAAAGVD